MPARRDSRLTPSRRPYDPHPSGDEQPLEPVNPKKAFSGLVAWGPHSAADGDDADALWHDVVHVYTGTHLSRDDGRFPALAGLASQVGRGGNENLAGLWRPTFLRDLLWQVVLEKGRGSDQTCRRQTEIIGFAK